jgi:glycosyltransferase involved in cell wall biosynthesis
MRKPAFHQFIVGAMPGDAITAQAFLLREWLREAGFRSTIFAENVDSDLNRQVRSYLRYQPSRSGEIVLLHHSMGSTVVDHLLSLNVRFLLLYHNVTPSAFFSDADPALVGQLERGRKQLTLLRERTLLALADSAYNERELRSLGYDETAVLPIVLDESRYRMKSNPDLLARYRDGGRNLLFVGRLVPNKRQEDLIKLLYYYRRIDPDARLFLVGASWIDAYTDWLKELAEGLGLREVVIFTDYVSQRDLVTYYHLADLYVSMSEHEGFGKPLIESMYLDVPVLAYSAAAVPGTLGSAGILVLRKDYEALAELVHIVMTDDTLRERVLTQQRKRVRDFLEPQVRQRWDKLLTHLRE